MVLFANQVKLLSCLLMTGEAVLAEAVIDVLETALIDFAAVLAYIDRKEFPVSGGGIESFLLFDHDFSRDQLYDRTFWVIAPALLGNGPRPFSALSPPSVAARAHSPVER